MSKTKSTYIRLDCVCIMRLLFNACVGILLFVMFTSCNKANITASDAKRINVFLDYKSYNYLEMKESADIIAHVKILDELTNENSIFKFSEEGSIYDFYSEQNAEVIKLYKNITGESFNNGLLIKDKMAISDVGELYTTEINNPLIKGDEYILFLKKSTGGVGYFVMADYRGKINLTEPQQHKNREIEFKFFLDYCVAEKNDLIDKIVSINSVNVGFVDFAEYENTTISTSYGDIIVTQAKPENESKLYFELFMGDPQNGTERSTILSNFKM